MWYGADLTKEQAKCVEGQAAYIPQMAGPSAEAFSKGGVTRSSHLMLEADNATVRLHAPNGRTLIRRNQQGWGGQSVGPGPATVDNAGHRVLGKRLAPPRHHLLPCAHIPNTRFVVSTWTQGMIQ